MLKKGMMILAAVMFFGFVSKAQLTTGAYVIENVYFANQVLQGSKDGAVKLGNVVGSQKQIWQITDIGNGMYRLEFAGVPTKCLDASAGTKGKVQLWDILGNSNKYGTGGKNQIWKIVPDGNDSYKIINGWYTTMVLEANVKTTGKVQLGDDMGNTSTYATNANNQRWKITKK